MQSAASQTQRMAKSTRSKVKRSFRAKKREEGVYAATVAARLNRLNAKLVSITSKDKDGDVESEKGEVEENLSGSCCPSDLDAFVAALGLLPLEDITPWNLRTLWLS
ncbi:hypothetical protein BJ138DRAFT_7917 [Hygrophoropsis aurantiaca]|uniref:Uncharacterized protein n=1 Tax=Hygrophoropsis aurantiaca TaxID=72124 RepID=A0ACB8ATR4_9AGAM|nr:hypothetical protein BJ138DRAFT_7917 [Hygrophoropsis aurantiaca]